MALHLNENDNLNDFNADSAASDASSGNPVDDMSSASSKKTAKKTTKKVTKKTTKKTAGKAAKKTTKKVAKKTGTKTTKRSASASGDANETADERLASDVDDAAGDAAQDDRSDDDSSDRDEDANGDSDGDGSSGPRSRGSRRSSKKTSKNSGGSDEAKTPSRSGSSGSSSSGSSRSSGSDQPPIATPEETKMLISYAPGEECRIAVTERGKLTEFDAESFSKLSRVGNIYLGRVTNVEAGVQAAFVDFGGEESGFLHVSDLHPQYFPGADSDETERVGKKTPRRERPLLQQALKKGQMVVVQVIKEGIGTKGPTVTSYLSIPGRFLVMMPNMDKVGVSRKVEDEDQRRAMRAVLDQIELPEGFGFILRTAGMDRNKTELKRDLSYLQRLWKTIEKAQAEGGRGSAKKPRLLYAESDLLVRSLRDQLTTDIGEVVIDHELALERAGKFMKIVAPRSSVKLTHYRGTAPMFHAFGVEEQVRMMHSNEVPLESGGRLVIDETEALVAIDVNSGRMRGARDAETNAYRVNLEAVDEICRQLRLRDLGGLVVNDLIDMRDAKHRKAIENRFLQHLKRDRAKSTILPISQFGILEMTRQRMRGSQQSQHFVTCPSCSGRGLLKRPGTVVAEALRDLTALLDNAKVGNVEMVVSPRVAGTLLSERRGSLGRIERRSGKRVDVRVSEALPPDRVAFYAYDSAGADVDLEKLKQPRINPATELFEWDYSADLGTDIDDFATDPEGEMRLIAEREHAEAAAAESALLHASSEPHPIEADQPELDEDDGSKAKSGSSNRSQRSGVEREGAEELNEDGTPRKKRRRRRRRRGKGEGAEGSEAEGGAESEDGADTEASEAQPGSRSRSRATDQEDADARTDTRGDGEHAEGRTDDGAEELNEDGTPRKKRRRRRRRRGKGGEGEANAEQSAEAGADQRSEAGEPSARRESTRDADRDGSSDGSRNGGRRGSRGGQRESRSGSSNEGTGKASTAKPAAVRSQTSDPEPPTVTTPVTKRKRMLYGGSRRSLAPSEKAKMKSTGDRS